MLLDFYLFVFSPTRRSTSLRGIAISLFAYDLHLEELEFADDPAAEYIWKNQNIPMRGGENQALGYFPLRSTLISHRLEK